MIAISKAGLASALVVLGASNAVCQAIDLKNVTFNGQRAIIPKGEARTLANGLSETDIPVETMFAAVGRGFSPITGEIKDHDCVRAAQIDDEFGKGKIEGVQYFRDQGVVKNITGRDKVSAQQAEFGFAYNAFSLGASMSKSRGEFFNSYDTFARLYRQVVTRGVLRRRGEWASGIESQLKNDLPAFLTRCGTHYVKAVYSGHRLDMTMRFTHKQAGEIKKNSAGLSVKVAGLISIGGGTADNDKAVQDLSTNRVVDEGRGALNVVPKPLDQDGGLAAMVNYADNGLLTAVLADILNSKAVPLYIVVEHYSANIDLKNGGLVPTWTTALMDYMLQKLPLIDDLQTAISDATYALDIPDAIIGQLYIDTKTQITQKRNAALALQTQAKQAAKSCEELMKAGLETNALQLCRTQIDAAIDAPKVAAVQLILNPAPPAP